ncbi:MAG: hypothetical protein EOP38_04885 [Rubrivivax sp.]|nr:MAG: hypothetical protein EOP38_04885 [Rubrivivax sp.]
MARLTRFTQLTATALLAMAGAAAQATDLSWSGFGTIGAAVSDRDYLYQHHIDANGTLNQDSVFGGQVDAQFTPEWSATLQAKLAPSLRHEDRWDLSASWAFVSWRPSNEWQVRAGKLRVPIYLFSENLDVGESYDLARMPTETYSIAPTTDLTGLYFTRTWNLAASELSLDVLSGGARVYHRFYTRDTGPDTKHVNTQIKGGVLSWRTDELTLRAGWLHANTKLRFEPGYPTELAYTPVGGGLYAYIPTGFTNRIVNDVFTLGMDWRLSGGWRVLAEYERDVQHKTTLGANTYGGHVAVLKTIARWTPYAVVAGIKSTSAQDKLRSSLNAVYVPGADQLMAAQRQLADGMPYYDQYAVGVGTSFALNANSKLKAEWMHTRIRHGSTMVDSPSGAPPVANADINVLSLSYNFTF